MQTKRTDYLVVQAMRQFLTASILTMIVQQLNVTIDGIIVSHYISPDALSAIHLYAPVALLIMSFATLFGIGATIVATKAMGECEQDKVNRTLSTAICSVLVFGIVMGLCVGCFIDPISKMICHNARLMTYFREYMFVSAVFCVIPMGASLCYQMVNIDGRPKLVTVAILIAAFTNLLLDLLFILVFKMGIVGAATATLLSLVMGALFMCIYLFSRKCSFTLRPLRLFSLSALRANMLQGFPLIASNLIMMLMLFIINNVIQKKMGADGMFALSVCMNLFSIGLMFANGVGASVMSIGGFLFGQKDYSGLRFIVKRAVISILSVVGTIAVVLTIAPGLFCGLFCARTSAQFPMVTAVMRVFVWMLPTVLLSIFFANFYQRIGYMKLTPVVFFLIPLCLVSMLYLMSSLTTGMAVWSAFPMAGILVIVSTFAVSEWFRKRRKVKLKKMSLVPAENKKNTFDASICVNSKSLNAALNDLNEYLEISNINANMKHNIAVCVEEVIVNVFQHAQPRKEENYLDILIVFDADRINVSVKDDGQPFDPIHYEERKIGLTLLNELCPIINYKYMYGQNMTFMTWYITND